MGNICDAMGMTGRVQQGNGSISSSVVKTASINEQEETGLEYTHINPETKSPVVLAAINAAAIKTAEINTAEIRATFAKKQYEEAAAAAVISEPTEPRLRLLPHQHTLFCERKQRVCAAVGELQEMEVITLEGFKGVVPNFRWIRIAPEFVEKFSEDFEGIIEPSWFCEVNVDFSDSMDELRSPMEYVITREDVGHFMGVRYEEAGAQEEAAALGKDANNESSETFQMNHVVYKYLTLLKHGVVKPGPPRLTDFNITGSMQLGTLAVAEISYIGGFQGASEFWWMRVTPEGKREQVTEPLQVPAGAAFSPPPSDLHQAVRAGVVLKVDKAMVGSEPMTEESSEATVGGSDENKLQELPLDPRIYLLTESDLGCTLKAKCRPMRSDGVQGEIFTSACSEEVIDVAPLPSK